MLQAAIFPMKKDMALQVKFEDRVPLSPPILLKVVVETATQN
jgi:hypothetical protein